MPWHEVVDSDWQHIEWRYEVEQTQETLTPFEREVIIEALSEYVDSLRTVHVRTGGDAVRLRRRDVAADLVLRLA